MTIEKEMTAREKRALKRREKAAQVGNALGMTKNSKEPTLDPLNYQVTLINALNYYNVVVDNKTKRKWVEAYVGKAKANDLKEVGDFYFRIVGTLLRLKNNGNTLEDREENRITSEIARIEDIADTKANPKSEKPVIKKLSVDEKNLITATQAAGEFEGMIDEWITNKTEPDYNSYLIVNKVSVPAMKLIPPMFTSIIEELKLALTGKDADLTEGYSNFTKVKLRHLLKRYEAISEVIAQYEVATKAAKVRKPRAKKVKPPKMIVKNVKYLNEYVELNLKSEDVVKLAECSEVWVYNTKYKKLQVYRAESGSKMTVKGTSLIGYSVKDSMSKTLRKPDETLANLVGMNKRTFGSAFKKLTTKEAVVNGRINQDCILLKIWS